MTVTSEEDLVQKALTTRDISQSSFITPMASDDDAKTEVIESCEYDEK